MNSPLYLPPERCSVGVRVCSDWTELKNSNEAVAIEETRDKTQPGCVVPKHIADALAQAVQRARRPSYRRAVDQAAKCFDVTTLAVSRARDMGLKIYCQRVRREWNEEDSESPNPRKHRSYHPSDLADIESVRMLLGRLLHFRCVPHIIESILRFAEYWLVASRVCTFAHVDETAFVRRRVAVGPFSGRSSIAEESVLELPGAFRRATTEAPRVEPPIMAHFGNEACKLQRSVVHALPSPKNQSSTAKFSVRRIRIRFDRISMVRTPTNGDSTPLGHYSLVHFSENTIVDEVCIGGAEYVGCDLIHHELDVYVDEFKDESSCPSSLTHAADVEPVQDTVRRNVARWISNNFVPEAVFALGYNGCKKSVYRYGRIGNVKEATLEIFYDESNPWI